MTTFEAIPKRPLTARRSTFIRHYGPTVVTQCLLLGMGIVTGVLGARMLGPVGRGEYAAITLWPLAVVGVLALGINQAIAFTLGRRSFTVSEVATSATIIGFVQCCLSIMIGLVVIHFVLATFSRATQHLGFVFVLSTPALILSGIPANIFQGVQDRVRFNFIRVMTASTYCVGLSGLYLTHRGGLTSVVLLLALGYVVALTVGSAMVWRILRPRWQWNSSAIRSLIHFGSRVQATSLTSYFNQRVDQLLLSLFVSPRDLGLYIVAVTLSTTVTVFPQAAGIVTLARGSSLQRDAARATIGYSFRASLIWLLLCCSALYWLCPFLIRRAFGTAFEGSILPCRVLLPGALMTGLNQVLYNGASALGRPGLPSCAEGVSMVVTVAGLYLLVPRYGYLGAAAVSSVAYTLSFMLMLKLAHKHLDLRLRDLLVERRDPAVVNP